eukprot:1358253-Rhodomonas_salina.1
MAGGRHGKGNKGRGGRRQGAQGRSDGQLRQRLLQLTCNESACWESSLVCPSSSFCCPSFTS